MELDRQKVKKKLLPFDDSRWWWFRKNCRLWASPWILWGLFQYITPKQKKNYRTVFPGFKNDDVFPLSHFQLSNVWGTLGIAIPSGNLNIAVENGHLQWLFHEKCWIFPVRYFDITRGLIHHTFHEKPSFSHGFPVVFLWFSYGFATAFTIPTSQCVATPSSPSDAQIAVPGDLSQLAILNTPPGDGEIFMIHDVEKNGMIHSIFLVSIWIIYG